MFGVSYSYLGRYIFSLCTLCGLDRQYPATKLKGGDRFHCRANELDGATGIAIFVVSALLIANALLALACTSFSDPGYLPRLTPEEAELEVRSSMVLLCFEFV